MLIFSCILEVLEVKDTNIIVGKDVEDSKIIEVEYNGSVEVKPTDQIILTGDIINLNPIKLLAHNNVSIRKFLEPLSESDLLLNSTRYTLIPPINNPFPERFKELLKLTEEIKKEDLISQ